jgi:hypothetical protein
LKDEARKQVKKREPVSEAHPRIRQQATISAPDDIEIDAMQQRSGEERHKPDALSREANVQNTDGQLRTPPQHVRELRTIDGIRDVHLEKDRAIVDDKLVNRKKNIYPSSQTELNREIIVGSSAHIGRLFGRRITIESGSPSEITDVASAVGIEEVFVKEFSHVYGPILSGGKISIGDKVIVYGDVIGKEVTVGRHCMIKGNILGDGNINLSDDAKVYGFIFSRNGGVAVGENSIIFDIIAQNDVVLGEGCLVLDSVLWSSKGEISVDKVKMGAIVDPTIADQWYPDIYERIEGVETSRISPRNEEHGTELNSGWNVTKEDLNRRDQTLRFLKSCWKDLEDMSMEYL